MLLWVQEFFILSNIAGIIVSIILIHLAFARISLYINSKFTDKKYLMVTKTGIEYLIIAIFIYYIFF